MQTLKDILKYHDFMVHNKNFNNFSMIDLTDVFYIFKKNDSIEVEATKIDTPTYYYYGEVMNESNIPQGRGICFLKSNNQFIRG